MNVDPCCRWRLGHCRLAWTQPCGLEMAMFVPAGFCHPKHTLQHKIYPLKNAWPFGKIKLDPWPLVLFPLLYNHSRRKNRIVSEAIQGGRWLSDVAHSLTNDLLPGFFQSMEHNTIGAPGPNKWHAGGSNNLGAWKLWTVFSKVGLWHSVWWQCPLYLPHTHLQSLGAS